MGFRYSRAKKDMKRGLLVDTLNEKIEDEKVFDARENPVVVPNELKVQPPSRRQGCCSTLLILALPIITMAFTLAFFGLLLEFDRTHIQETGFYGNENIYEMAGIYYGSANSDSFSYILSQYEPYSEIIALSSVACILVTMTTVARNIQIEVYQKEIGSFIFMKFINYLAATVNILSYMGLITAVAFKVDQEDPPYAVQMHFGGALTFFAGTSVYSTLHSFLLLNQTDYPIFLRLFFLSTTIVIVTCSILYGLPIWEDGMASENGTRPLYAWITFFMSAISMGFYSVLFFIDPVDKHLIFFFCGNPKEEQSRRKRRGLR